MVNPAKKIQRTSQIISVLIQFGFKDLVARLPWSADYKINNLDVNTDKNLESITVYTRIRMVLEALGPAFVKLGQAATTREGLLPEALVDELKKLEDKVQTDDLDIKLFFQEKLGKDYEDKISWVSDSPFASASISQVYKATLINGEDVVIKVRRPNIKEVLLTDLALMKDLANLLAKNINSVKNLNLPLIVESFANSLTEEISLLNEKQNMERFAANFAEHKNIYVPKVYPELCNDEMLCIEFINGIKVTEIDALKEKGFDLKKIVNNGLNLYLEQVLIFGFFHGDPHPGNLLVLEDERICFIDFGNMGKLLPSDKEDFEEFILTAAEQNAKQLGEVIENIALYSRIIDRTKYERTLNELFEVMSNVSIGALDLQAIFSKVWKIIGDNQIHFPEYIYQLIRGISLIEGIGKKLDPELNILAAIKPFSSRIVIQRLNPSDIAKRQFKKLRTTARQLEQIPSDIREIIKQTKKGELSLNHEVKDLRSVSKQLRKGSSKIALAIMFLALLLLAGLVILAKLKPFVLGLPIWALLFLLLAIFTAFLLFILIFRDNKD